jgi:two-component system, LytTR family, response regulator LytT
MNNETLKSLNVLIIEDEPFAREELKRLLGNLNRPVDIIGTAGSVEESIHWFEENPAPDLVFMDIQLSDGLSFEIFSETEVPSPVIFTTAFDEYAIRAFKVNSVDYLLKPLDERELEAAIHKFESLRWHENLPDTDNRKEQIENLIAQLKPRPSYKSRFIAKVGDQIKYINVEDIAYFFAEDNIVFVLTDKQGKYIVDYSLNELEAFLDPQFFFRLNRSYYVHIKAIAKVHKFFNSRLKVDLHPAVLDDVLVSRVKVPAFLSWMEY